MSISLADQRSAAEQGLQVDRARLSKLQAEREELVNNGGDTSSIDSQINIAQADVNGSLQDVADAQQSINDQAQKNVAATETAGKQPTEPDTSTDEENSNQEDLNQDEEDSLERNSTQDDNTGTGWNGEGDGEGGRGAEETAPVAKENSDDSGANPPAPKPAPAAKVQMPKPMNNPLHEYATYTYGVTLFILSKDDYNKLQKANLEQIGSWNPTYALISSAGKYQGTNQDGISRQAAFKEDFYFDNLRMQTIVGLNATTRGTNAVEINFNIVEPYGLTLLDRIIDASKAVGCKNYLEQPYLLQIDFYGSRDLGEMEVPIPKLSKRIPIKLIGMKIKVGTKGADYAIQAIPFNHSALRETTNTTPANFEIKATTVEDFFKNTLSDSWNTQTEEYENARVAKKNAETQLLQLRLDAQDSGTYVTPRMLDEQQEIIKANDKILKSSLQNESYTGAVNAWNQKLVDNKHTKVPNIYKFNIDKEIADSAIVDPTKVYYSRMDYSSSDNTAQKSNNSNVSDKTPAAGFNRNKMTFNINAGTSMIDVVNMVLKNSRYIKDQVVDPYTEKSNFAENKEVNFFKIIPQVELGEFDDVRQTYGKIITLHIKKFSYYNSKHPNLPYSVPGSALKLYNYIYTGKNIDILDFAIDFDSTFFTALTVNRDNAESSNPTPGSVDDKGESKISYGADPDSIGNNKFVFTETDLSVAATGADNAETALTSSVMKSIYSQRGGDMVNVKLKILGDPHFIKQDDVYANPGQANYDDAEVMINDGTIAMDKKEIFCRIQFNTPSDMSDRTGLAEMQGKYAVSKFSGLYRILTVDNEFSRGQFVQTLECIRIFDKPEAKKTDNNRNESNKAKTNSGANTQATEPTPYYNEFEGLEEAIRLQQMQDADDDFLPEPTDDEDDLLLAMEVEDAETQYEDDYDSDWSLAEFESAELGEELLDSDEVELAELNDEDSNSPEPQNPILEA